MTESKPSRRTADSGPSAGRRQSSRGSQESIYDKHRMPKAARERVAAGKAARLRVKKDCLFSIER